MVNKAQSFLVINPFGIGDVVFTTPVLRNLKENFPQAKIFYLCNRRVEPILKTLPLIDEVFVYERDEFEEVRKKSKFLWLKKIFSFISEIRRRRIDVALDFSLNSTFGFFSMLAGIKHRLGLDYKNRGRFLTKKIKISGFDDKHVIEYYLGVLNLLNIPVEKYELEIYSNEESRLWANEFCKDKAILGDELVIGVAPCGGQTFGANAFMKRWPKEKFSSLIDFLIERFNAKIFIFAGFGEEKEVNDILFSVSSGRNCYKIMNYSLPRVIALIEKCALLISNDTGPLRLANALGKKIVTLFGPVDEKVYGLWPLGDSRHILIKKDLPCRPCYRRFRLPKCAYNIKCLGDIGVEEVFAAVRKLIERNAWQP